MSGEELLKSGDYVSVYKSPDSAENRGYLSALRNSLIERYKRNNLSGGGGDVRILATHGSDNSIGGSEIAGEPREQYSPMLVDVREFVKNPKIAALPVIPAEVRLQPFNLRNRVFGNPREGPAPDSVIETLRASANGECRFFSGLSISSRTEFPYKVIQGRSKVLEAVADNERNLQRDVRPNDALYRLSIQLHPNVAQSSLEVPIACGYQRLVMLYGPEYFTAHGIKRGHASSYRVLHT